MICAFAFKRTGCSRAPAMGFYFCKYSRTSHDWNWMKKAHSKTKSCKILQMLRYA